MRTILLALALFLTLAATASAADPSTYLDEADRHWGDHPCAGQVQAMFGPMHKNRPDAVAQASGIRVNDDGSWTLIDCAVTVNPAGWDHYSPSMQCAIMVHEVGHLGMHRHEEGGVMAADVDDMTIPAACDFRTPRERAIDTLLTSTGADAIACGKQKGKVFYCRTENARGKVRRFRVRAYTGGIAWREVRVSKRPNIVRFR